MREAARENSKNYISFCLSYVIRVLSLLDSQLLLDSHIATVIKMDFSTYVCSDLAAIIHTFVTSKISLLQYAWCEATPQVCSEMEDGVECDDLLTR